MKQEIKINQYTKYRRYLVTIIGEESFEKLVNVLGGNEASIIDGSFGMSTDSGCAYSGSMVELVLQIADYACKLNDMYPEEIKVERQSIYKVVLLQHLSKILMFERNDNDWEVRTRGFVYKFSNKVDVTLKGGECSLWIANNAGIPLTIEEYEAMRVVDKQDELKNNKWYLSTLAMIVQQANDMVTHIYRKKAAK